MTVSARSDDNALALPRALTVMEPWASAIIHAGKNIENRPWPTQHRGPLLIHAGRGYDRDAPLELREQFPRVMHGRRGGGQFIGVVNVIDCHAAGEACTRRCATWGRDAIWHWELADPRPLTEPLPARGQLGLWRVDGVAFGPQNLPTCGTCGRPYTAAPCGRRHALIRHDPARHPW